MRRRLYFILRDLHLYIGLFLVPFVLVFALSVFFLVHSWMPGQDRQPEPVRTVRGLMVPEGIEWLDGRARVDALRILLPELAAGEIGFVRHVPAEHRLIFSVWMPGREAKCKRLTLEAKGHLARKKNLEFRDGRRISMGARVGIGAIQILFERWLVDSTSG